MKVSHGVGFFAVCQFLISCSYASDDNCFIQAGTRYNIDPVLIYAVAVQESSLRPHVMNQNSNGSFDYGLMQINSIWLPVLRKYNAGLADLKDPCYNIHVGSWILAQSFAKFGKNWRGLGAYNAGFKNSARSEFLRKKYAVKVLRRYENLCISYRCNHAYSMY